MNMVRVLPGDTEKITNVSAVDVKVHAKRVAISCDYAVDAVSTHGDPYSARLYGITLEDFDIVESRIPPKLMMEAVSMGLGDVLISETISRLHNMTTEPTYAMVPLFFVDDIDAGIVRVVYGNFALAPIENNGRYRRLALTIHTPFDFLFKTSSRISYASDSYADLGMVSINWTMRDIKQAASRWFAATLQDLSAEEVSTIYSTCSSDMHKFKMSVELNTLEIIESIVTGKCSRCTSIEHVRSADVPF